MFTKHIEYPGTCLEGFAWVRSRLDQGYASLITESVFLYFLEEYIQD